MKHVIIFAVRREFILILCLCAVINNTTHYSGLGFNPEQIDSRA